MLTCWVHLYGHSSTGVGELETDWGGLETGTEQVAEGVWKLLLSHRPFFRTGVWDIPLPGHEGWSLGFVLFLFLFFY